LKPVTFPSVLSIAPKRPAGLTVAVGEAESVFVVEVARDPLQTSAGHRAFAGVHQGDTPRLGVPRMYFHGVTRYIERHIRHMEEVIGEILLDHVTLVPAADNEVVDSVMGILLHYVPEYWATTDLHHGFRPDCGLLTQASAQTTGKNDGFQRDFPEFLDKADTFRCSNARTSFNSVTGC
jgi:hypothetical protein